MNYLIHYLEDSFREELQLFRLVFSWATRKGNLFEFTIEPAIYEDKHLAANLLQIGHPQDDDEIKKNEKAGIFFSKRRGKLEKQLIDIILSNSAPDKAISGDVCPVMDIKIFIDQREIFLLQDYGRIQLLDISEKELSDLKKYLKKNGLDDCYEITPWEIKTNRGFL